MLHGNRRLHNPHQLLARQQPNKNNDEENEDNGEKPPRTPKPSQRVSRTRTPVTTIRPRPTTRNPLDPTLTPLFPPTTTLPSASVSITPDTDTSVPLPITTPLIPPASIPPGASTKTSHRAAEPSVARQTTTVTVASNKPSSLPTQSSNAQTVKSSSTANTGAIAGGVVGGIAGAALLGVLIFFIVRHYRRKSLENLAFNASKFRNSALILDDPPAPPGKQNEPYTQSPSMLERQTNTLAVPQASASNPYADHAPYSTDPYAQYMASANQYNSGIYGADGQIARDPYAEMYGGNVTGAAYGQHARYGQDTYGQDKYGAPYTQSQLQYSKPSFSPGQIVPFTRQPADDTPLPNPFSNNAVSASAVVAAVRSAAAADSPASQPLTGPPSYINRQPSQNGAGSPTKEHDANYMEVQRDTKVAPGTPPAVSGAVKGADKGTVTSNKGLATSAGGDQRPPSSFSLYDASDAYGGMK